MGKILVIDDDEYFRGTLAALLEKHGFEVLQAPGGASGVQLARALQPDLILCDVNMEGADGRLALFALRRDPQVAAIPFVLMSGQPLSGDALPGTGRGADGFLHKPFSQETLLTTVERCLCPVERSGNGVESTQVIPGDARGATPVKLLEQIIEVTGRISASAPAIAPDEARRLARQAHESALRLSDLMNPTRDQADMPGHALNRR